MGAVTAPGSASQEELEHLACGGGIAWRWLKVLPPSPRQGRAIAVEHGLEAGTGPYGESTGIFANTGRLAAGTQGGPAVRHNGSTPTGIPPPMGLCAPVHACPQPSP
ncbi:MAG: hypothetical protein TE42_03445 [Candidatus Synechococcus spongiarum SP3]|uniref:Uncharacterized protein n=1 Tax=Candidatus Synechococcus spongiarum SP3 TaxID=1604020 RepID=A0A0G2J587_9SYNE|nr:MAG: hypothetical protein TE42_03445 [Candidatus Synechococcus spongiarum SP3]